MLARLTPMPFKVFKDPVRRSNPAAEKLPRTFIRCLQWPNPMFDRYADTARETAGWRYRELPTSHEPFVTHPQDLTNLLLERRHDLDRGSPIPPVDKPPPPRAQSVKASRTSD